MQQAAWDWGYLHDYLRFFITGVTILVSPGGGLRLLLLLPLLLLRLLRLLLLLLLVRGRVPVHHRKFRVSVAAPKACDYSTI